MSDSRKSHWEDVYITKDPTELSWYQGAPQKSLQMISATGVGQKAALIDIGGGASTLVDNLLDSGFDDVTVLDIASAALLNRSDGRCSRTDVRTEGIRPRRAQDTDGIWAAVLIRPVASEGLIATFTARRVPAIVRFS